jgi:hypothetical protein
MVTAPTAGTSQAVADREAAWVAVDCEATMAAATTAATADARAAAVAEATCLVTAVDKLEMDAARARQEATHACAALAAASSPGESAIVPPPPPRDDDVFWAYCATQAHVAVTALHAQAVSVLNVKAMILVFLDNLSPHYNRGKTLFLNTLGKYEPSDHVLINVTTDPHWWQMDYNVPS